MIYGLYESAGGMLVNEYRQGVIANNIANAETVGFKRDIATFAERPIEAVAGERRGASDRLLDALSGGTWLGKTETDYGEGALRMTKNPYDAALAGPGFLRVRDPDGNELLTRDGRMRLDPDGRLLAAEDDAEILGAGGQPIRLNSRDGEPTIDEQGVIRQAGREVGRLAVVDVSDYSTLKKAGASRFAYDRTQPTTESPARVLQHHLESSGVTPIQEMVQMLEATRAYQLNAQMVTMQDQSVGRLISTISGS